MSKMTGPYGGHAAEPHMMHKQFDLRIQQQRAEESSQLGEHLGRPRSARYQARHISRSSGTASDTQNKMIALGFIALLTSSFDEFGGLVPRPGELSGPIPSRRSAAPQPEVEKTVKPVEPEDAQIRPGIISQLVNGLAPVVLGPLGGLLVLPTQASAQDVPEERKEHSDFFSDFSRRINSHKSAAPHKPSDFDHFDPSSLGPVGKFMVREGAKGIHGFNTYVRENQEHAGTVLEIATYVSGAISGGRACAVVGPWAALGGALAGLVITFAADCGTTGLREKIGEERVNAFVNKAIDIAIPPLKVIFPNVDDSAIRIAVSGGAVAGLLVLHVKSIAVAAAEGAVVVGIEDMVAHGVQDTAFKKMMFPSGSYPEGGIKGEPWDTVAELRYFAQEDQERFFDESGEFNEQKSLDVYARFLHEVHKNPDAFFGESKTEGTSEKPFSQVLHQAQQNVEKEFVQSANDLGEKVKETSRKLSQAEKNPDPIAAAQEKKKIIESARAEINDQQVLKHISQLADIGSSIALLTGNSEFAYKLHTGTHAVLGIISGVEQFISVVSSGAGAAAALGPIGIVAGGLAALSSLFSSGPENGLSEQLSQVYKGLTQQISELTVKMVEGFRGLSDKIDILDYHLIQGFAHVEQELRDHQAVTSTSLQQMESWLQELMHVLAPEVHELVFKGVTETCLAIDDFPKGLGSFEKMEEKEFWSYVRILENALRGVSPRHEFSNGFLFDVTSAEAINRVSKFPSPESLLGFWANFVQLVLHMPLGIDPRAIPNRESFLFILSRYRTVRKEASHILWDDRGTLLEEVGNSSKPLLAFPEFMHNNSTVVEKLLTGLYQPALERVRNDFSQEFAKVSDTLVEEVHSRVVTRNRQKIDEFPAYPEWQTTYQEGSFYWRNSARVAFMAPHYQRQSDLVASLDQGCLNKQPLKISIERSRDELLSSVDTSVLNGIVSPKSGQPGHLLPIPLSLVQTRARSAIANYVPKAAYLAQAVGLGTIECQYVQTSDEAGGILNGLLHEIEVAKSRGAKRSGGQPFYRTLSESGETISLEIVFRKNDGAVLPLGGVSLRGACTTSLLSIFPPQPWAGYRYPDAYSALESAAGGMIFRESQDFYTPFVYRVSPHRLKSIWENANVEQTTPINTASTQTLLTLIDKELISLRKKGISPLYAPGGYAPTELGMQLRRDMEVLDAAYNPIGPLTTIAGFNETEQQELLALPNSTTISRDHRQYLEGNATEGTSFMPHVPEGGMGPIVSRAVARYTLMPKGNRYSASVEKELAALGLFRREYPDIVRRREEKIKQKAAEKEERASSSKSDQKIEELTERVAELMKRLERMKV